MTVLVTGATGFLGGRLAQVLAGRADRVRVLARPGSSLEHLRGLPIEVIEGSLADTRALRSAVEGAQIIYHCAGCSTDWAPWPVYFEANVSGVRNLLAAAMTEKRLERFLHVSTTDVYGYPRTPCDESAPLKDVGLPYNRSKCLGEQAVWEAQARGLPVTVVRPATIYGPRGTVFATEIAQHLRQGTMAVIAGGRAPGGFCYVDNCVDAMVRAAASSATLGCAYNLSDGTGATWRTYVDALASGLGLRRPWIDLPASSAFAIAKGMEAAYRVAGVRSRPPLTRHAVFLLSRNQEFPIEKANQDFSYFPKVPLDVGVASTVAWLRDSTLTQPALP